MMEMDPFYILVGVFLWLMVCLLLVFHRQNLRNGDGNLPSWKRHSLQKEYDILYEKMPLQHKWRMQKLSLVEGIRYARRNLNTDHIFANCAKDLQND